MIRRHREGSRRRSAVSTAPLLATTGETVGPFRPVGTVAFCVEAEIVGSRPAVRPVWATAVVLELERYGSAMVWQGANVVVRAGV